jgi:hypothetical protein
MVVEGDCGTATTVAAKMVPQAAGAAVMMVVAPVRRAVMADRRSAIELGPVVAAVPTLPPQEMV